MIPKPLANAIVVLVSLVWAGNFFASVFVPGYQPDSSINFVFMAVVGSALALRRGEAGNGQPTTFERVIGALRPADPPAPPAPPPAPEDKP